MKVIYNPNSEEKVHTIINGNPSGIANFVKPSRVHYKTVFEGQIARFWNPATVALVKDKKAVKELSEAEYRAYELTFGKLIFNDSVITNRLMDNINSIITDTVANACIAFQSGEEALHSYSYAFIGDDVLGSTKVYDLFKTDPMLRNLADKINARYGVFDKKILDDNDVKTLEALLVDNPELKEKINHIATNNNTYLTDKEKAFAAIANLCLEGISFPAGFIVIWALGYKMQGSANMITEISRNELGSHLPLYINIYNDIKTDAGINIDELARETIIKAGEDEKEYIKYSTKGVMGFDDYAIDNFMNWIVDNRLRELELKRLNIDINTEDGLIKIYKNYSELNNTKTNFFEGTVKNYSKQSLQMDDF